MLSRAAGVGLPAARELVQPSRKSGGRGAYVSVVTLDAAFSFLEIQKEITGQVDVEVSTTDSSQRCFY